MRIAIEHVTRYTYHSEARYSVQSLRFRPAHFAGHAVCNWAISTDPGGQATQAVDGFGNAIELLTISEPHRQITIRAQGVVDVEDRNGVVAGLPEAVPARVYLRRTRLTMPDPAIERITAGARKLEPIPRLHAIMAAIRDAVEYRTGSTSVATTAAEAVAAGHGVCQDHAHIFITAARLTGIPARYVTGYLLLDDESHADAHHAWAEAWIDGLGWVGFDAANGLCPTDRYVRLAAALDAAHAAPVRGTRRGGDAEHLDVEVKVRQEAAQQSQQ
jgi:transglutaminase-like putative cysteine protease